jgi:deferrochelatase/peroxidase EfeB
VPSFGFEDGVSQPLLAGINTDAEIAKDQAMKSAQAVITVTANPPETTVDKSKVDPSVRPPWMIDGSFLVFRKLEQDVAGFNDLVSKKFSQVNCLNAEHCGAKIMGRWKSGTCHQRSTASFPCG